MKRLKERFLVLLKWLETYTKTDMVYLAKGGFWTILSQIMASASSFLLAMAFARFISKEAYGQYKYILSLASILGTFTLTGLGTAVLRGVNRDYEGTMHYAFWKNIRWSILFFLIALFTSIYYFVNGNTLLGTSLLVVGCFLPFWNSTNYYNSFLVAKKDFRRSAIYFSTIGNIFPALCIFTTILLTSNPLWLVTVYFISNTLIGLILYVRVIKLYKPNNKVDDESIKYSKHLSFLGIIGAITDNIDQILVFHYIGPAQLAIYNFAVALPSQIKGPMKGLAGLILPKFVERSEEEIRKGMSNKILVLFLSSLVIIGAYILAAPFIYHLFFPKYSESILYSQIFSLSLVAFIAIPADTYFTAKIKVKEQYFAVLSGFVIQIVLLFLGIYWGGFMGLVIAHTLTKFFWALQSILIYKWTSRHI
jgi:O-antigen/teichoic acid export membrane protein